MAIITSTTRYHDGDVELVGCYAYDDTIAGQRPVVLVSHAWGGRDRFVDDKARQLAELGYLGFALDMYGNGKVGSGPDENARLMQPFLADRALLQRRMAAALAAARALPQADGGRVAAIGFCFGGLCVLDLARMGADVNGVVSFHGLLMPPGNVADAHITAKVLVLHGYDDPMVPVEQLIAFAQEMTAKGVDWQVHGYGHTLHAFTNPTANDPGFGTVYNADADRRSWQAMRNFLSEVLA